MPKPARVSINVPTDVLSRIAEEHVRLQKACESVTTGRVLPYLQVGCDLIALAVNEQVDGPVTTLRELIGFCREAHVTETVADEHYLDGLGHLCMAVYDWRNKLAQATSTVEQARESIDQAFVAATEPFTVSPQRVDQPWTNAWLYRDGERTPSRNAWMRPTPDSSNVDAIGWSAHDGLSGLGLLYVQSKGTSGVYRYENVPGDLWRDGLRITDEGESVGKWVNAAIKPHFDVLKLTVGGQRDPDWASGTRRMVGGKTRRVEDR